MGPGRGFSEPSRGSPRRQRRRQLAREDRLARLRAQAWFRHTKECCAAVCRAERLRLRLAALHVGPTGGIALRCVCAFHEGQRSAGSNGVPRGCLLLRMHMEWRTWGAAAAAHDGLSTC